jgi:hypothetical protein
MLINSPAADKRAAAQRVSLSRALMRAPRRLDPDRAPLSTTTATTATTAAKAPATPSCGTSHPTRARRGSPARRRASTASRNDAGVGSFASARVAFQRPPLPVDELLELGGRTDRGLDSVGY